MKKKVYIVGTVGVPSGYGGFETLVENLLDFFQAKNKVQLTVFCSGKRFKNKIKKYKAADLIYLSLDANGIQSILYDIISIAIAVKKKADVILILGVSGAICLPLIKLFSNARIVTNVDGMEWKRAKWHWLARRFLKFSEKLAAMYSDVVIADNKAIKDYLEIEYSVISEVIAYGGDHALNASESDDELKKRLPKKYAFSVCRIEPENNVHLILEAFSKLDNFPLFFVGNWDSSEYGRDLKKKYGDMVNIKIIDPVYDISKLYIYRKNAFVYLHGHRAGGTNPSLVEAMQFGVPIIAYDCIFNRETTKNEAMFFMNEKDIRNLLKFEFVKDGKNLKEIAKNEYSWGIISKKYFDTFFT